MRDANTGNYYELGSDPIRVVVDDDQGCTTSHDSSRIKPVNDLCIRVGSEWNREWLTTMYKEVEFITALNPQAICKDYSGPSNTGKALPINMSGLPIAHIAPITTLY